MSHQVSIILRVLLKLSGSEASLLFNPKAHGHPELWLQYPKAPCNYMNVYTYVHTYCDTINLYIHTHLSLDWVAVYTHTHTLTLSLSQALVLALSLSLCTCITVLGPIGNCVVLLLLQNNFSTCWRQGAAWNYWSCFCDTKILNV